MLTTNNSLLQHQAHVWVSDQQTLETQTIAQLQKILCKQSGCGSCTTCRKINDNQHPYIYWYKPEESYNLDDIDQILDHVKFKLNTNEYRFFIFTHAHELTPACSNRLLKTIEEPHPGYYFIFLASRTDTILPTILSRSFFKEFPQTNHVSAYTEFIQPFISQTFQHPATFTKMIDKLEINPQASKDIVDTLIVHFYVKLKHFHQSLQPNNPETIRCMNYLVLLQEQLNQLPTHGSSKIFWKHLYLKFHFYTL